MIKRGLLLCLNVFLLFSFTLTAQEKKTEGETNPEEALLLSIKGTDTNLLYHYDPQNRRDPFYDLVIGLKASKKAAQKGVKPFYINEAQLNGIIVYQNSYSAMVTTPEGETFTLRKGDKLLDGEVTEIGKDFVRFRQLLKSPIMLRNARDVVKKINSPEEE